MFEHKACPEGDTHAIHRLRLGPVSRLVRNAAHARSVRGPRAGRPLHRRGSCAGARASALRRDSRGGGRGDRGALAARAASTSTCCGTRPRSSATRSCRSCTSWPRWRASPAATSTGARPRRTSWTRPWSCRCATHWRSSRATLTDLRAILVPPRAQAPRHADGGPHPSAAGAAGDLRLQGRGVAGDVRPPRGALAQTAPARAGRSVRRRRRHAGLARRQGTRGAEGPDGRTRPRRARHDLARGARWPRRSREPARADHRLAGQDRLRRDADGVDGVRRGLRAVRQGSRREQHHAAEAQSDLQRADASPPRRRCARTPA